MLRVRASRWVTRAVAAVLASAGVAGAARGQGASRSLGDDFDDFEHAPDEVSGPARPAPPQREAGARSRPIRTPVERGNGDGNDDVLDEEIASAEEPEADLEPLDWRDRDPNRARAFRALPTLDGPTGGLYLVDGHPSGPDVLRALLVTDFFVTGDYLGPDDSHTYSGGLLAVSLARGTRFEPHAQLRFLSNSNSRGRPALLHALGDASVGVRVRHPLSPLLSVAADGAVRLPTGRDLGVHASAIGARVRAAASVDLSAREQPLPVVLRFNLGYELDNSAALVEALERERYRALADPRPVQDETRHLLTRIERRGFAIDRTDALEIGLGAEASVWLAPQIELRPLVEWRWQVPVNRQGYDCVFVPAAPGARVPSPGEDGCIADASVAAFPMDLVLGARVLPPVRGLVALAAVELGLLGASYRHAVRELAQNEPWLVMLGVGYAFDLSPPPPRPPTRFVERVERVEVPTRPPPAGRLQGFVLERGALVPIERATVRYLDRDHGAQATDAAGRFVSDRMAPGPVSLRVEAEGYEPADCAGEIPAEGDGHTRCELERRPQLVVVERTHIELREQIHFAFDSDVILPESFGLMEQIRAAIAGHPELRRIEIQGHTDDVGTEMYNLDLSQRRALSVRRWLVERGIEPDRLLARGYGEGHPLVRATTEEARARNRRVEFRILERAEREP
ncbi:MAG: OmpA family protein [Myxococcota bacterium]|nr:OmpA family protein [Myxococcota bacterium]MDW8362008.1 OmpA family protein [Myxococcales bacterium]